MIAGCFIIQKLYGRQPENIEAINQVFHRVLAGFPADKVLKAFDLHLTRSQEFPTPADIVGLIKRGGRPPMSESMYVTLNKKDPEHRTPEDWQYLRDFESEMTEGSDFDDAIRSNELASENIRLRQRIMELQDETRRLSDLLHEERMRKGIERPAPSLEEKVQRTAEAMRQSGASEEDVQEFLRPYGLAA